MSTKCSLAYGEDFHFYQDLFDEDIGYTLEITEKCCDHTQKILIPYYIWETIKESAKTDLSLADKTDDDLFKIVENEVDSRLEEYNKSEDKVFRAFFGSAIYGPTTDSKEDQIESGMSYFKTEREKQQKIVKQINDAKRYME